MKENLFSKFKTKDLAEKVGCSYHYLRQIRCGMRKPSIRLAKDIEMATEGQIKVVDLLPGLADIINGNP
jgi:DNA-binding transcriptional regulator YdaS (Cro superfamily)